MCSSAIRRTNKSISHQLLTPGALTNMRTLSKIFVASILCLWVVSAASAGEITYQVTVDTSSIAGTTGSFDLPFNPGPLITQAASLDILKFGGNGSLVVSALITGNVVGALPGIVTFQNSTLF